MGPEIRGFLVDFDLPSFNKAVMCKGFFMLIPFLGNQNSSQRHKKSLSWARHPNPLSAYEEKRLFVHIKYSYYERILAHIFYLQKIYLKAHIKYEYVKKASLLPALYAK